MDPRDTITTDIDAAAAQAFRGEVSQYTDQAVGSYKIGLIQGSGRKNEVLNKTPLVQHYGFASAPPATAEVTYLETDAGVVSIGERTATRVQALTSGQACVWDENDGILIAWNNSGTHKVTIGKRGGTGRKIARYSDTVDVYSAMTTWMSAVQTALNTLGQPISPLVGTTIGTISSGSDSTKVND